MIRWRRMSGYNALWVPGVDHAGIATQVCILSWFSIRYQLTFIYWKTYTDSTMEFLITSLVALAVIQLMKHTSTHHAGSVTCWCATTKIKLSTVNLGLVSKGYLCNLSKQFHHNISNTFPTTRCFLPCYLPYFTGCQFCMHQNRRNGHMDILVCVKILADWCTFSLSDFFLLAN
jgi:hypothetical protein